MPNTDLQAQFDEEMLNLTATIPNSASSRRAAVLSAARGILRVA